MSNRKTKDLPTKTTLQSIACIQALERNSYHHCSNHAHDTSHGVSRGCSIAGGTVSSAHRRHNWCLDWTLTWCHGQSSSWLTAWLGCRRWGRRCQSHIHIKLCHIITRTFLQYTMVVVSVVFLLIARANPQHSSCIIEVQHCRSGDGQITVWIGEEDGDDGSSHAHSLRSHCYFGGSSTLSTISDGTE